MLQLNARSVASLGGHLDACKTSIRAAFVLVQLLWRMPEEYFPG